MNKLKERILNLDVLRIFAGVAVVAIHVSDAFVNYTAIFGGLSWWIANIINSFARISVPLFIVISGSLLIHRYDQYGLRGFLKKGFQEFLSHFCSGRFFIFGGIISGFMYRLI